MNIRICDDDPDRAEDWVDRIRSVVGNGISVERLEQPLGPIEQLVERKKNALEHKNFDAAAAVDLDAVDILVVDYDLIHIDEKGSRTTGEGVARLARAYSRCKFALVVNQFNKVDFDLGMTGHLHSFADLNVDGRVVGEEALWRSGTETDFRPSIWTPVIETARNRALLVEKLGTDTAWGVLEFLGLTPEDLHGISDTAFSFLSQEATNLAELPQVSAADVVLKCLGADEGGALIASAPDIANSFVVSRLAKWLDRAVLRPMNTMIDAARLAERWPFLIDAAPEQLSDADYWRSLRGREQEVLEARTPVGARLPIADDLIGRPVYVLARFEDDEKIHELSDNFDYGTVADVVYAEDTSRFVPRQNATEFRAGFNNFNDRRFVEKLNDRTYGPQRRFAFGD